MTYNTPEVVKLDSALKVIQGTNPIQKKLGVIDATGHVFVVTISRIRSRRIIL